MQSKLEAFPRSHAAWCFILVSLGVAMLQPAIPIALIVLLAPVALVVFVQMAVFAPSSGRSLALSLLMVLQLGFWIAFARIVEIARVMAEVESALAMEIFIFAPLLLLAPLTMKFCAWLDSRGLEPTPAAKFSIGFLGLAAACTCLASSITSMFGMGAVVAGIAALTFASLSLGPACAGAIFELAPRGQRGIALGCWVLAYVFARTLGGWMHARPLSPEATFNVCLALGYGLVAVAVLSSFMWNGLEALATSRAPARAPVRATVRSLLGSVAK